MKCGGDPTISHAGSFYLQFTRAHGSDMSYRKAEDKHERLRWRVIWDQRPC